jgi:hypothetical protein
MDTLVLQFLVEWLLQKGDNIKAFTVWNKFESKKRSLTSEFVRLELDHYITMPVKSNDFCGRTRKGEKFNAHYVM